jgi:hypothetical protein
MENIKCFLIECNGMEFRSLRTYGGDGCPKNSGGYHNAHIELPAGPVSDWHLGSKTGYKDSFPTKCDCGHVFSNTEKHEQLFSLDQYTCKDKPGQIFSIRNAPVGAIWRNTWYEDIPSYCGTDGKSYTVETPDGPWHIDGTAKNCGLPNDTKHKCWCRHGEAPDFTVDKVGFTCNAGAGSIQMRSYHGFLQNGFLTNC